MKGLLPKLLSVCMLIALVSSCSVQNRESVRSEVGIELTELSGDPIALDELKGKTVFINVWATWCGPCIREMPSIESAGKIFGDSVKVFMASEETTETIEAFIKRKPMQLHFVQLANANELNLPVLPATYIINPKGDIAFFESGARKWDDPENVALVQRIAQGL